MKKYTKKIILSTVFSITSFFIYSQNGVDSNGKKHGSWEVKVQGKTAFQGNYNHGLKSGIFKTYYHNSGGLQNENYFVNDKLHGLQKAYSQTGVLLWSANYSNGVKVGKETKYYPNGNIKAELNYASSGELEGNIVVYDEQGNVLDQKISAGSSQRTISN